MPGNQSSLQTEPVPQKTVFSFNLRLIGARVNDVKKCAAAASGLVLGLAISLVLSSASWASAAPVTLEQAQKSTRSEDARRLAQKSEDYLAAGDLRALTRHLAYLKAAPELQTAAREKLLYDTVLGMAALKPDDGARGAIDELTRYPSETLVWREEHGHREARRLYDVAAAARFTARRWSETAARDETLRLLTAGDPASVTGYPDAPAPDRRGVAEAFAQADLQSLAGQRDTLAAGLEAGARVGDLALVTATRLKDPALMRELLRKADGAVAVAAVRELDADDRFPDAVNLLLTALERPATTSAAMLALGRLAPLDPGIEQQLLDRFGAEDGASAAAALARVADVRLLDRIAGMLATADDERRQRHALLALRLSASDRAAEHLRVYASDPATPDALRREVPSWLRD